MLKENFLLDDFVIRGSDLVEFKEVINEMDSRTNFIKLSSKDISVASLTGEHDPNRLLVYLLDPKNPLPGDDPKDRMGSFLRAIEKNKILKRGDFESLIKEVENKTQIILYDGFRLLYVSEGVFSDLCQFGMKGDFVQRPTFARDLAIAQQFKSDKKITLVCKNINGINKAFAIRSGKYTSVPQTTLLDIIERIKAAGLGECVCREWEVTNFMTQVYLEFPEKAEELKLYYDLPHRYIPGIWLATSDTGNCSVVVNGTWRSGNSISLQNRVAKQHSGSIDIEEIIKNAETAIFAEYTKLPEALCDLMMLDITNPSWDLSTKSGLRSNAKAVEDVIKYAFKQLNMVKIIGKKNEKALYTQVTEEIDPSIAFTAYDIAKMIMELPERIKGLNPSIEREFKKAAGQAPYLDYFIGSKSTVTLTV